MKENTLTLVEAILLIVIVEITHILLDFPNELIKMCSSSVLLNIIFITILALIFFLIVNFLFKPFKTGNILDVANFVGGKNLKFILSAIYLIYLIIVSAIVIRNFSGKLKLVYFPNASLWSIIALFILTSLLAVNFSNKNLTKLNAIFLPIILFAVAIIFILTFRNSDSHRIFPILGNGFSQTFIKGISNIYIFSGLIYLLLFRSKLNNINQFKKIGIMAIILSSIYLLLGTFSMLALFPGLKNNNEIMSFYLSTKIIRISDYMPRIDSVFMFMWIFNFLLYLSIIMFFSNQIIKSNFTIKNSNLFNCFIALAIFIISLIPNSAYQITFFESNIYKILSLSIVFVLSFIILVLGYLKKKYYKEYGLEGK